VGLLQATWHPSQRLLLWATAGSVRGALEEELPELVGVPAQEAEVQLAAPGSPAGRWSAQGLLVEVPRLLTVLPGLRNDPALSDSVRCWSMATRLALELAARQAAVPDVDGGEARWRVLLARPEDQERFQALATALPVAARLVPLRERGPVRLHTSAHTIRSFMDAIVDALFRQGAWPGTARGWMLELAEALRGAERSFQPRDARFFGVPAILASWSRGGEDGDLRVGFRLSAPPPGGATFELDLVMWPADGAEGAEPIPMEAVWRAGGALRWGGRTFVHPAWTALRGLARAQRLYPPLRGMLAGAEPHGLQLDARAAWSLLADGVQPLRDAGFVVELPESFQAAGSRRIRARMRLELGDGERPVLGETVRFRWEIVLGDRVLPGSAFREILGTGEPIVRFRGEWVLLDPAELKRLPAGLPAEGTLDVGSALRAVLTGQHEGVTVVADDRLTLLVEALRHPPERTLPLGLRAELRPYQGRGYAWLSCLGDLGLGACLADDMGLGKTLQVIAHILERRTAEVERRAAEVERRAAGERGDEVGRSVMAVEPLPPTLVVCPTSLLGNWVRELERFAPALRVVRHHGSQRDLARARLADVVLTTYGLLARDHEELSAVGWDVVVLDEAQAIKNPEAQRARSAFGLRARHRVALTGTPVENRLEELWSIFHYLVPGLLGARGHFRRHVALPIERLGDAEAAQRLRLGTSPFLLRRLKTDPLVAPDLPDKVERHAWCSLTGEQASLYRKVAEEHLERVADAGRAERRGQVLAMLTALKQVCNHPAHYLRDGDVETRRSGKLQRAAELLDQVLDRGERMLIFTQYREMGLLLQSWLEGWLLDRHGVRVGIPFLHGSVAAHDRDAMVRAFQEDADAAPVLLVSLRAGGVGLNLTRATAVLHYDRWWNPAVEDQATDRAYRIGQQRNVQVFKLVVQGTLEERIDAMLRDKRQLADSVVASGEHLVTELDDDALRALVALGDDAVLEEE
jgi:hypothetical protein